MNQAIRPLRSDEIDIAIALVQHVFPEENGDDIRAAIAGSLDQQRYQKQFDAWHVTWDSYWVVKSNSSQIIGIIGLYTYQEDQPEAFWLGWYCVHPSARGTGLGRLLLEHAISTARQNKKKYLRLYTSTNPNEATANRLYDKLGFRPSQFTPANKPSGSGIIYRELDLTE